MDANETTLVPVNDLVSPLERGLDALREGRYAEAAAWLEEAAVGREPGDREVMIPLAEARIGQGRYAEAEAMVRPAYELDPKDLELRGLLGAALACRGD